MDRLAAFLREHGAELEIFRHDRPLRTAREGAEALGIRLGQTAPAGGCGEDEPGSGIFGGRRQAMSLYVIRFTI